MSLGSSFVDRFLLFDRNGKVRNKDESDATGRILKSTLQGTIIGSLAGGFASFWYELPNVPKNTSVPRSILVNLGFLGKYVAAFGGLAFTYQFSKEAVNSFYNREVFLGDVAGGLSLGVLAGLLCMYLER